MGPRPDEDEEFVQLPPERFYRGVIARLNRGRRTGLVRAASGREIPFNFAHVTLAGWSGAFEDLREGMQVGFDVAQTSHGLRVTVLRPMPDSGAVSPSRGDSSGGPRGPSGG